MLYIQRIVTTDDATRWDTASTNALNSWKGNGQSFGVEKWLGTSDSYDLPIRAGGNEVIRIHYLTKNTSFGSSTDLSYRVGIISDSTVGNAAYSRGGNNLSTHYSGRFDNSSQNPILVARNDQQVGVNTVSLSTNTALTIQQLLGSSAGYAIRFKDSDGTQNGAIQCYTNTSILHITRITAAVDTNRLELTPTRGVIFGSNIDVSQASDGVFQFTNSSAWIQTVGDQYFLRANMSFSPTSGTATYRMLALMPTINQTGGASGITGAIFMQPTLTAAADFRYISAIAADSTVKVFYIGTTATAPTYVLKGNGQVEHYSRTAPGASVADGFIQYSADVVAGHAVPHFRTEAGNIIKLYTQAFVAAPAGGATIDVQSRAAIDGIRTILINAGFMAAA